MDSTDSITYKIFDSVEEIKSVKDFWISNQWQHYTDFDYYLNIVIHEKGVLKPHIIIIFENENPILLLIGNICEKGFKLKLGYKSLLNIKVHFLEIMYGGILGDQSPSICKETIYFLKKILAKEEMDYIFFKQLNVDSNIYKAVKEFGGKLSVSKFDLLNPHIYMDIPTTYEKLLETIKPNERKNIKRYARKLEKDFKGKLEIKLYQNLEDIEIIMKNVTDVASQTYQYRLGVTFIDDEETRKRIQYELQNKRLLVLIMYIEGKPVAFDSGLVYGGTMLGTFTGYLKEYCQYRVGLHLIFKMIAHLCENDIVRKYDFGFGDAEYKKNYGNSINIESNLFIYSSTLKGILLNLIGMFNRTSLTLYRNLSAHFEIIRRIKKKSRDKLRNT